MLDRVLPIGILLSLMNRRSFALLLKALIGGAALTHPLATETAGAAGDRRRLIVIGAGLAGLAAARRLKSLGHEVTVLEGRDRIGGRTHTSTKWKDLPVDLGASWIHESKGNPLTALAREAGAKLLTTNFDDSIAYHTDGSAWTPADEARFEELQERVYGILEVAQDAEADQTLRQALNALVGSDAPAETRRLVNFLLSSEMEAEYSGSVDQLSAYWFDDADGYSGPDQLFAEGFRVLVAHLSAGLNILTGKAVTAIDWSGPGVRVVTTSGEYRAEQCLVTLPLGVLKTGNPVFTPALPAAKRKAIAGLGMGLVNKCFLRFPSVFWPEDVDWIGYVPATHGEWTAWLSFAKVADQPVLLGFLAADVAAKRETLSDAAIVASAMKVLRTIYGQDIPEPEDYQITRWAADPFARGSYSFNAVNSTPAMRTILAAPVGGRLFFAGEATEKKLYATAHGAYLSGLRAAEEMG